MSSVMLLSIFLAASGVGDTWIRSNWDEAGGGLEIASRMWVDDLGEQKLWLVGVSHIGEPSFYEAIEELLESVDVVVFESVLPHGALPPGGDDDASRASSTAHTATLLAQMGGSEPVVDWASWISGNTIDPRTQAILRPLSRDGWGRPWQIQPAKGDQPAMLSSFGSDGKPGGVSHAADIEVAIQTPMDSPDASTLQRSMAESLGLVFQLDHLPYGDARWIPGDLTIGEIEEAFRDRQMETVDLTNLLTGKGLAGGIVHGLFRAIPTLDQLFGGRISDTLRIMLIEMLSDESLVSAAMDMQGPAFEEVLLDLRNQRGMEVALEMASRSDAPDIAVVYGAAHMPGMAEILEAHPAWRAESELWRRAITFKQSESILSDTEVSMLRRWSREMGKIVR